MKKTFQIIFSYWLEILLGGIFLACGLYPFLFYFFIIFLVTSSKLIDYLRKLIRAYQIFNEVKILAIIRKLKISDDEISIVLDGEKLKIGDKKWAEIEKEINEITG
jgi:hypothetical protein